ncbi:histone deacetylase family protein [Pseudogulbenkiania subflava]|uniref:Acetoin utilization deacetylase AcuC n=1 Tax=Pseudogulbenkiania subflava DSM 22618 TaxID=1123014 RepID=A0A1Y6C4A9_9NEIS|nr:histone deacetylase [Pseudogulbenkiania subflava]SMF42808.1 Acetoin utilization deacetylase AcuC [Pseudogulbenkiania subflava DSM 22618]
MRIFRTDHLALPLPPGHRFPAEKYRLLAEAVAGFAAHLLEPAPAATPAELCRAHDAAYVHAFLEGSLQERAQREIGLPWSPQLATRASHSVGATIAAARVALLQGCGVNLAGGTHHAQADKGSGFCVFNDVAVAARLLLDEGHIRRALVIDLDVHQGNGTAALFRDEARVFTFSMHGQNNFPFRKVAGDRDVELPDGTSDETYLALLSANLEELFRLARPDLVFYLAGADPYRGDRLGKLGLTADGLLRRDQMVLDACQRHEVGVAIAMAGGYAVPIEETVAIQTATVREAVRRFDRASPRPPIDETQEYMQ